VLALRRIHVSQPFLCILYRPIKQATHPEQLSMQDILPSSSLRVLAIVTAIVTVTAEHNACKREAKKQSSVIV